MAGRRVIEDLKPIDEALFKEGLQVTGPQRE
jgi:hypothetical protein